MNKEELMDGARVAKEFFGRFAWQLGASDVEKMKMEVFL